MWIRDRLRVHKGDGTAPDSATSQKLQPMDRESGLNLSGDAATALAAMGIKAS